MEQTRNRAIAAILLVSISYGFAGYTARELQQDMGPWQQVAIQSWLGLALAIVIQRIGAGSWMPSAIPLRAVAVLGARAVFGRVAGSMLFITACIHAPLANVAWISSLPTAVGWAWLLSGERVSKRQASLLAVGIGGVALIVNPTTNQQTGSGYGELLALLSVVSIGFATIIGRDVARDSGAHAATTWVVFWSAVIATAGAIVFEDGLVLPAFDRMHVLGIVTCMVVLNSTGSLYGFAHLSPSTATAILTLEAVWAMAAGTLLYAEHPTAVSIIGGAIIAGSAMLMDRVDRSCSKCPTVSTA